MHKPVMDFIETMRYAGLSPPSCIEPNTMYRFAGSAKGGDNKAAWCKLFEDGLGGVYGDFSSGLSAHWRATREAPLKRPTPLEREAFNHRVAEAKAASALLENDKHAQAALTAMEIWKAATLAPANHPYLVRKGIAPNDARLYNGTVAKYQGALVIPMRQGATLYSLQFIAEDGGKLFLPEGRKKGCYCCIGKATGSIETLGIAEGFATGATIHEATGYPVAVAFDAGNLEAVALALRVKFPKLMIVICADDDAGSKENTGLTKAIAAAKTVGGIVAVPLFGKVAK